MTTLDDYSRSERSASNDNCVHIYITVNVVSETARELYAFKLGNLEKVVRELYVHGGHASVESIYYDSLLLGIVKSREELAELLRLAERRGRIEQDGHSAWRIREKGERELESKCNRLHLHYRR